MPNIPPSHEIDARYAGRVFQIMEECAATQAGGWTKLGLIVNQSPDDPSVLTYPSSGRERSTTSGFQILPWWSYPTFSTTGSKS